MLLAQLMRNETAYAWVLLTLNRTIPRGVLPYISHIGTGKPPFNMDISLARTVGFVLGERKPLTILYTYTFYGPLSVRIIGVWFFHPYHEFSGVPPGHHSNDVSGFELFTLGKKRLLTVRIKKKCFGNVLIEKPLAENIIKVNNLCPL